MSSFAASVSLFSLLQANKVVEKNPTSDVKEVSSEITDTITAVSSEKGYSSYAGGGRGSRSGSSGTLFIGGEGDPCGGPNIFVEENVDNMIEAKNTHKDTKNIHPNIFLFFFRLVVVDVVTMVASFSPNEKLWGRETTTENI